jgi:hypothetical protein
MFFIIYSHFYIYFLLKMTQLHRLIINLIEILLLLLIYEILLFHLNQQNKKNSSKINGQLE